MPEFFLNSYDNTYFDTFLRKNVSQYTTDDLDVAFITQGVIEFKNTGGSWVSGTTTPTIVSDVRITRNGTTIVINFPVNQTVRLADNVWTTDYQTNARLQPLYIDMKGTDTHVPISKSITYKFLKP